MNRKILTSALAISLLSVSVPAFAGDSGETRLERDAAPAIVEIRDARPERLSTRDRWRGAPYVRSSAENERLRSEALDKALPVNSPLGTVFSLENEQVRAEALDKALPIRNPALLSGSVFGLENEQIRAQALDKALPIANSAFATGFGF